MEVSFMSTITLNRQRLAECRMKLGITKQEAAKRMEMSQPAYLRYESGERTPSIQVIYLMADVLGTSADYLLDKTDNPSPNSYIVKACTDPELFRFVEHYLRADEDMKKRITAYMKKLADTP